MNYLLRWFESIVPVVALLLSVTVAAVLFFALLQAYWLLFAIWIFIPVFAVWFNGFDKGEGVSSVLLNRVYGGLTFGILLTSLMLLWNPFPPIEHARDYCASLLGPLGRFVPSVVIFIISAFGVLLTVGNLAPQVQAAKDAEYERELKQ